MMQERCYDCPRRCGALRPPVLEEGQRGGVCGVGTQPVVARAMLHLWEEPCISGTRGSGAVFFSGCSLGCVFCQNDPISHGRVGESIPLPRLRRIMERLISEGAHNINLVNPTHFTRALGALLEDWRPPVPVVYNTGGYDSPEGLARMEGKVDVYLPDLKYVEAGPAARYSGASDYFAVAREALPRMARQIGESRMDAQGILRRGMIVRHLILPGQHRAAMAVLDWIHDNLPPWVMVSLMCQYLPMGRAREFREINRRLTSYEYNAVLEHLDKLGMENGYVQERSSAREDYVPAFNLEGLEE